MDSLVEQVAHFALVFPAKRWFLGVGIPACFLEIKYLLEVSVSIHQDLWSVIDFWVAAQVWPPSKRKVCGQESDACDDAAAPSRIRIVAGFWPNLYSSNKHHIPDAAKPTQSTILRECPAKTSVPVQIFVTCILRGRNAALGDLRNVFLQPHNHLGVGRVVEGGYPVGAYFAAVNMSTTFS